MAKRAKSASEAVAASMAKARAEGRVRLSGYLSREGSMIANRLAAQHGGRNAAIEMALRLADEDAMSPAQALRVLARLVKEAA